jgi:hypothetical protein
MEKVKNATKMKNLLIISFILAVFLMGCSSTQKTYNDNFYDIVNIMLYEAKQKRDSIHIIDWKSKEYYKESKEIYYNANFSILNYKENKSEEIFSALRKRLVKHSINIDKEIPYFKKQLKSPINLDKKKITLKELKIFPVESDWYSLKYNYNFTNYYYVLSKPLITKNGLRAIYYHGGSDYANFFTILAKNNNKWEIIDKFNANYITMD